MMRRLTLRGTITLLACLAAVALASLLAALSVLAPAQAAAAAPPQVAGASVLSSTSVKVIFSAPAADPSATSLADYGIAPDLPVSAASLSDGGYSVVLTTATQLNGQSYTVTASNIVGADGTPMMGPSDGSFIGTNMGPDSSTSGHDDFNRPSGLLTTDAPIPGPWLSSALDPNNSLALTASPVFNGAGALDAFVHNFNPQLDNDNADLQYKLSGAGEDWLSAYIYVPSGQGWGAGQEVDLVRFMQNLNTSMARVSAVPGSGGTSFGLDINWKTTGNAYLVTPPVIASDVPCDAWEWLEMHVREATSSSPGEIQVWLNGSQIYGQESIYVYPAKMTYVQAGIGHVQSSGPDSRVITDEVRFGDSYELPSSRFDMTPPSVSLTSPAPNGSIGSTLPLTATATDNVGVQRVDFLIDGSLVYSDDLAPYQYTADTSALGDGTHTVTAIAYDTSGNASARSSVAMAKGDPTLTGFSPAGGPIGTAVTLGGAGLSLATAVAFNGSAAHFTVDSDTQITATVPAAATSGPISVTTPGGTATSAKTFSVTPPTAKLALKLDGLSAGTLRLGKRVTMSVHLTPTGLPDERVTFTIERRRKGHWHAVVTRARTTSSAGLATITYKPAHKGTYRVRATLATTAANTAAASAWLRFVVK